MDTTETLWSVDGQSLQTYAWNISTLGNSRESVNSLRGENLVVPYVPGETYIPKVPEAQTLSLGMWVQGCSPDGSIPTSRDMIQTYQRNWRMLRRLLWSPRRLFTLEKRMWVDTSELSLAGVDVNRLPSRGPDSLYPVSAKGHYHGGLDSTHTGSSRATFTVDIRIPGAFFYGAPITKSLAKGTHTVYGAGDEQTNKTVVTFRGPQSFPSLFNETTGSKVWYTKSIAAGDSLILDTQTFTATLSSTGANVAASIQHSGGPFWATMDPGVNRIVVGAQSTGVGMTDLTFESAWW